jgi:hypothetical protein
MYWKSKYLDQNKKETETNCIQELTIDSIMNHFPLDRIRTPF